MAGFQELPTVDDDVAADKYGGAIPGQSLTDEPGGKVWENPPELTDPDEAVTFVVTQFEKSEKTQSAYSKLMLTGMPIESIVNTIAFGGFVEGKWTVDVAELIKPPLMSFFIAFADENEIPYKVFNNPKKLNDDGIPDHTVLPLMADRNPEAFAQLQEEANYQEQENMSRQQGFLAEPPPIEEEMIDVTPEEGMEIPMEEI